MGGAQHSWRIGRCVRVWKQDGKGAEKTQHKGDEIPARGQWAWEVLKSGIPARCAEQLLLDG